MSKNDLALNVNPRILIHRSNGAMIDVVGFEDRYLGRGLMVVFFGSWLLNSVGIIELIKAVNSYA